MGPQESTGPSDDDDGDDRFIVPHLVGDYEPRRWVGVRLLLAALLDVAWHFALLVLVELRWKPDEDLVKDLVSPGLQVRSLATGRWVSGWVDQVGQGLYTRNMQTQHCFHPSYKLRKQSHVLQGQDKTGCLSIIQVVHLSM